MGVLLIATVYCSRLYGILGKSLDLIHKLIFENQHNCIYLMIYFSFILGKWNKIHSTEEEYLHLHCNSCCEQRALTPFTKCMCLSSSPFVWTPLKNCGIVARFQNWERTLASDWIENWIHPMVGLSVLQAKERTASITLLKLAWWWLGCTKIRICNLCQKLKSHF